MLTGTVMATLPAYPGGTTAYLAFHLASAFLIFAACLPPVSYGYTALTLFLTLGFWVKTVAATIGLAVLVEPTGAFSHRPDQWDAALAAAAAGLVGLATPKVFWFLRSGSVGVAPRTSQVPSWYSRGRGGLWLVTILTLVGANALNWVFRFYALGVHPRLVLPLHLNVVMAWWLTVGSGMWLAVLLDLEQRRAPHVPFERWLLVPAAEALLTTCVMLSRGFYLMKVLPYALVALGGDARRRLHLAGGTLATLAVVAVTGFALSLVAVSWLRLMTYPPAVLADSPRASDQARRSPDAPVAEDGARRRQAAPPPGRVDLRWPTNAEVSAIAYQLSRTVLGRWIGLEGVLAVTSSEQGSWSLLQHAAREDPNVGSDALFQRLAGSPYRPQPNFTFLTLPGVLAVMAYSGSAIVTAIGMGLVACLVLATEATLRQLFSNEFLCAVVGVAMANAFAQMNFPYLTLVFFIQLWATIVALRLLLVVGSRLPGEMAAT